MAITLSPFPFVVIVVLGVLPAFLWLLYFLRHDPHPEPKSIILQLFLVGFLLPPFVAYGEIILQRSVEDVSPIVLVNFVLFLLAAFWEEAVKYLAARSMFHHEKEFDEESDAMVYLITIALGFAASENIIHMLSGFVGGGQGAFSFSIQIIAMRSVGATFLHALASGVLGYFLARSIFLKEHFSLLKGFIAATAIHTLFNWLLYLQDLLKVQSIIYVVLLLLIGGLAITLRDFSRLKKLNQYNEQQ